MITKILAWLFGTAMGRGLLLGGSISLGVAVGWWLFSSHYEKAGYAKCQSEHAAAQGKANEKQAKQNIEDNRTSDEVGRGIADGVAGVINEADKKTAETKETVHHVYRDPPRTAPVSFGSCVHPLDPRVQEGIDAAVSRASRTP